MELVDLATKQVKRTEYTKHPFSKRRLRVLDVFSPIKKTRIIQDGENELLEHDFTEPESLVSCPACKAPVDKIMVVESDMSSVMADDLVDDRSGSTLPSPYYVLSCSACNYHGWYVILS